MEITDTQKLAWHVLNFIEGRHPLIPRDGPLKELLKVILGKELLSIRNTEKEEKLKINDIVFELLLKYPPAISADPWVHKRNAYFDFLPMSDNPDNLWRKHKYNDNKNIKEDDEDEYKSIR